MALCGIFQCSVLIENLAVMGMCDEELFEKAISTIFKINAPTTMSIFEEPCYIANGAENYFIFSDKEPIDKNFDLRYHVTHCQRFFAKRNSETVEIK